MALVTPTQNSFNGGLWSPRVFGRHDIDAYRTACSKLTNFIPSVDGHLYRRSGTIYAGATKTNTGEIRLIPFIFSSTDSMVLELGNLYIRFWKNGSQVLTGGGAPYEIATTYTAAQLVEIDWAQNASTFILTHPSHPVRKLQRVADNNWTYEQLEFKYGPYLGRGQVAPGVVATATSLNVDTPLWLVSEQNPSSPPISNQLDFRRGNPDDVLFTAREGPDSTNAVVANVFDYDRDVGRKILLNAYNLNGHHNSTGSQKALGELADSELAFPVYGTIADVENEAAAGVSVGAGNKGDTIAINFYDGISAPDRLTNEGAGNTWISTQMWFLSPFYGATENPATCTFFEERLWLGRTALAPELFYGSRTGTIDDFDILSAADSPPQLLETQVGSGALRIQPPNPQSEVIATSALSLGVSGNEISEIQWMRPLQSSLLVATSRAIYQISSATNDGAFGPTNGVSVKVTNAIGSTLKGLATIRDKLAFMLPAADRLYQMGFELSADSFTASDMSLFNPDIFAQGLQYASISEDHEPIYWAVTTEDKLIAMTVDDRQRVFGAHEHELGGTDVKVQAVAVVPNAVVGDDDVYLVVSRTINGSTVRYVEYIGPAFRDGDSPSDQHFVDCGVIDTSNVTTITGLGHLEGETVQVLVDGAFEGDFTVSGGSISIENAGAQVHIGLKYTSEYHSMPLIVRDPQGSSFSKRAKVNAVNVHITRSTGGEVAGGPADDLRWRPIPQRRGVDPIGLPLVPVTGVFKTEVRCDSDRSLVMAVRHALPFNFELTTCQAWLDSSSR